MQIEPQTYAKLIEGEVLLKSGEGNGAVRGLADVWLFSSGVLLPGAGAAGMKSANFADSYKKYLGIREKAGEDPLVAEIRRQIAQ